MSLRIRSLLKIRPEQSRPQIPFWGRPRSPREFLRTAEALEAARDQKTIKPVVLAQIWDRSGPKNHKTRSFGTNLGPKFLNLWGATPGVGTNLGPKSIPGSVPDATGSRPGRHREPPGAVQAPLGAMWARCWSLTITVRETWGRPLFLLSPLEHPHKR